MHHARGRRAGRAADIGGRRVPRHDRTARSARVTPRTKALLFVSPSNPTGAVYPPDEVEAIGRWALERGIWIVTDEIYEHLTYDGHVFSSMPGLVPELMDQLRDPQRCRQDVRDDGLARRLDDRAARRHHGRDQLAVALDVERVERRAGRRARGGAAATSPPLPRCATRSRGAASMMYELLSKIDGVSVLAPQGAFYCFPSFEGVLGPRDRRPHAARPRSSSARCCSTSPRSRSFPARRSARPATPGSRSRSATTTSAKASAGSPPCSRLTANATRAGAPAVYPRGDGAPRTRLRTA